MSGTLVTEASLHVRPISLELGYPGEPPPPRARARAAEALARAASVPRYPPPEGEPALRRTLAETARVAESCAVITHGASGALVAAIVALTEPGAEVLCPNPGFPAFAAVAAATGRRVRRYRADGDGPLPETVERALTPATRLVVVNSPSNPLGTVASASDLAALRELIRERSLALLADEVYAELVFDGEPARVPPAEDERTVVVGSFSKAYGLPGFRVGYALAAGGLAREIARAHWRFNMSVSEVGQAAALGALEAGTAHLERVRDELRRRRDEVCTLLAAARVPHVRPAGGLFVWIAVGVTGLDGERFVEACRRTASLVVSPGAAFGPAGVDHVRLSFGGAHEDALEGARRLATVYGDLIAEGL